MAQELLTEEQKSEDILSPTETPIVPEPIEDIEEGHPFDWESAVPVVVQEGDDKTGQFDAASFDWESAKPVQEEVTLEAPKPDAIYRDLTDEEKSQMKESFILRKTDVPEGQVAEEFFMDTLGSLTFATAFGGPAGLAAFSAIKEYQNVTKDPILADLSDEQKFGRVALSAVSSYAIGKLFNIPNYGKTLIGKTITALSKNEVAGQGTISAIANIAIGSGAIAISDSMGKDILSGKDPDIKQALISGARTAVMMAIVSTIFQAPAFRGKIMEEANRVADKARIPRPKNYQEARKVLFKAGIEPDKLSPHVQRAAYQTKKNLVIRDIDRIAVEMGISKNEALSILNQRNIGMRKTLVDSWFAKLAKINPDKAIKLAPFRDAIVKGVDPIDVFMEIEIARQAGIKTEIVAKQMKTESPKLYTKYLKKRATVTAKKTIQETAKITPKAEVAKPTPAEVSPLATEAKKFKTLKAFEESIKKQFIKEQGYVPSSMKVVNDWFKAKQTQPFLGTAGGNIEFFQNKPSVSELPKDHPDLKRYEFTDDGKVVMYRGIDKKVETRGIRYGDFLSADKNKASFFGKVERYELDPSKVKVLGDLEAVYIDEDIKTKIPIPESITEIFNKAQKTSELTKAQAAEEQKVLPEAPIVAYHGTGATFEQFDTALGGSITGAKSAQGTIFFTDNPDVARAYAVYAAERGPVKKLMDKADKLERLAQIAQKKGQEEKASKLFDEMDKVLLEAEKADSYDETFKRRELANVKEVTLSGDFYEVDAEGKTPQELSDEGDIDSWLNQQIEEAKKLGKDGVIFRNLDDAIGLYDVPSTHYAVFDAKNINQKAAPKAETSKKLTLEERQEKVQHLEVLLENATDKTQIANLKEQIAELKPKMITKSEITLLKDKIKNIQSGIKTGKTLSKKEAQAVQDSVISMFKDSDLEIPVGIKNIQTAQQFDKMFNDLVVRIERLVEARNKKVVGTQIKKALKYTKPVKVGQRRVAKYDYESNKLFESLRGYSKSNQEQAQVEFDKFPDEPISELDLIKKRFLSLKANGVKASLDIYNGVLKDIVRMKELGSQAKDEASFLKLLEREEKVDNALESIDKIKANKKTVKTKIGNAYRRGFSNIYSMLNSIAGKDIAIAYDPELSENQKMTDIFFKTKEVTEKMSTIYEQNNPIKVFESLGVEEYKITDFEGLVTDLTKFDLLDTYNAIKNDKTKADYYEAYGETQVNSLLQNLTDKDRAFADYLQETVQSYRGILNERNIEITGRDLGFIENYWPGTSEHQESVLDDMRVQGETPSALKERVKTKVIPTPTNAWLKAQRHITQAEHVKTLSRKYEGLRRLFINRRMKHDIIDKFGKDVYNTLMSQIDRLSLNAQVQRLDAVSGAFRIFINNWVTSKIALNPSTFVRQLISVGNFAEVMPAGEWVSGFKEGILSPKKTFDFVWKNAPFLEARFNRGYSEALTDALDGANKLNLNWGSYTKFLSSLARTGDITAIVYGGYPVIKAELAKGKSIAEAVKVFEQASLKAQQSGLASSISEFQNSKNPFARLFLAFKNTSNQYFRKMVDSVISFQNGDIDTGQLAKTMSIYAIIQPILFAAAGFAVKEGFKLAGKLVRGEDEDWEDFNDRLLNAIMIQLAVSPFNAIPVIDDIVNYAARKVTGAKAYKVMSTPFLDDIDLAISKLSKKEITAGDYLIATTAILEPITAAPIRTGIRIYEQLFGKKVGAKPKQFKGFGSK